MDILYIKPKIICISCKNIRDMDLFHKEHQLCYECENICKVLKIPLGNLNTSNIVRKCVLCHKEKIMSEFYYNKTLDLITQHCIACKKQALDFKSKHFLFYVVLCRKTNLISFGLTKKQTLKPILKFLKKRSEGKLTVLYEFKLNRYVVKLLYEKFKHLKFNSLWFNYSEDLISIFKGLSEGRKSYDLQ